MSSGPAADARTEPEVIEPVVATPEEIRLARELRRLILERYPSGGEDSSSPAATWCVGAD